MRRTAVEGSTPIPTTLCNTVTIGELLNLIATSGLVCGNLYTIIDPFANSAGYGTVTVTAISSSTVNPYAVWNKTPHGISIGGISYATDMAGGDSIDTVTLNGLQLNSVAIPFNTDIFTTMQDLANDITSTGAAQVQAVPTPSGIIISAYNVGNTFNGQNIASTTTGFTGSLIANPMQYGEDISAPILQLPCYYDVLNRKLLSVTDYRNNNTVAITSSSSDTNIFAFPFNFDIIRGCNFLNCFIDYTSISANTISLTFSDFTAVNIQTFLFNSFVVEQTEIKNYNLNTANGGTFVIKESVFNSNSSGLFQGTFDNVLFNNAFNDGVYFRCSGSIVFDGSPGGGQVGTDVFVQTSPDKFCAYLEYAVKLFCDGVTGNAGATLRMGTVANSGLLIGDNLTTAYAGAICLPSTGSGGPETFSQFIFRPTVDDTTAGTITYVIEGLLAP